jgi:hypothetical protein
VPRPPLPERLTSQALAGEPLRSAEQVAGRLLAVQGQDPRGARLAVRARTGLVAISKQLVEREDRLLQLKETPPPAPIPLPRLLGAYDPVLLGGTSREEIVGGSPAAS